MHHLKRWGRAEEAGCAAPHPRPRGPHAAAATRDRRAGGEPAGSRRHKGPACRRHRGPGVWEAPGPEPPARPRPAPGAFTLRRGSPVDRATRADRGPHDPAPDCPPRPAPARPPQAAPRPARSPQPPPLPGPPRPSRARTRGPRPLAQPLTRPAGPGSREGASTPPAAGRHRLRLRRARCRSLLGGAESVRRRACAIRRGGSAAARAAPVVPKPEPARAGSPSSREPETRLDPGAGLPARPSSSTPTACSGLCLVARKPRSLQQMGNHFLPMSPGRTLRERPLCARAGCKPRAP